MNIHFSEQVIGALLTILVAFGVVSALLTFALAVYLAAKDGIKQLRRLHQIPCHRCAYYTGSHYLKCTLHPLAALSEDAIGCRDYELSTRRSPRSEPVKPCQEKPQLVTEVELVMQQTSTHQDSIPEPLAK
ncbi:MAG: hypothetical protein AAFY11_01775 [Cyanobacteria bacterium J06641_5]